MPTVIIATVHNSFGRGNSRRGGEEMDNEEITNNINESLKNFVDDRPTAQEVADEFSRAYREAMKDPHFAAIMELSDKVAENIQNERPRFWGINILEVMGWLNGQ